MRIAPEPLLVRPHIDRTQTVRSAIGFRYRGVVGVLLLVPAGIAALFSTPDVADHSMADLALSAVGWLAFLCYLSLRVWATLYVGGRKDRELQTEGPYSLCRNPLYLGSFAFAVALACFLKSFLFCVLLLPACLFYFLVVVRAEERFLEARFQEDYRRYCRRTPRFWPKWTAFRSGPSVRVELQRFKKEAFRLSCAGLFVIVLQVVLILRFRPDWPHWFVVH